MEILTEVDREADNLSMQFIEFLGKQAEAACADAIAANPEAADEILAREKLRLFDVGLKASKRHQERLKAFRLQTAKEMRGMGVPMTEISAAAKVNDSYLARLILQDPDATRRSDRTRRRRTRGAGQKGLRS